MVMIGINGFGRIGRITLRNARARSLTVAAVNDPFITAEHAAYLYNHDTVHGAPPVADRVVGDDSASTLTFPDGSSVKLFAERNPADIDWTGCDAVIESTGVFKTVAAAGAHRAKLVVISAPSPDAPMFVCGVNAEEYDGVARVISNASCTTNCLAPLAKVLHDTAGIEAGLMTTIHAATATQMVVDGPSRKDWRGGRSVFNNLIPSSTGAAAAVGKVIPALNGLLTGMAVRVPVPDVSLVDLTVHTARDTSLDELLGALRAAGAPGGPMDGILRVSDELLVSSDLVGDSASCVVDARSALGVGKRTFKICAYYDNELAYSMRILSLLLGLSAMEKK